jgi:hypothetical protein
MAKKHKPKPEETPRPTDLPPQTVAHQETGAQEIRHADGRIEHPTIRRELTDVRFLPVFTVILGIVVLGAIIIYATWIVLHGLEPGISSFAHSKRGTVDSTLPAEPRLEPLERLSGNESANAFDRQLAAERKLTSYGPTDEQGFVHIPIEQAIKLIVPKLPIRKTPACQGAGMDDGLLDGGGPNSGRIYREAIR